MMSSRLIFFICLLVLVALPLRTHAFGAGNIASISKIEGHNWRHGDIEDMLKSTRFLHGHKWTSMLIKRVYFGNWLRDYSQAMDVGSLKNVQAATIKLLIWILSFMSFGYATAEFEITDERLGVYRPEEHIDNPRDYADNQDARQFDPRLRGPVAPEELALDPDTGMKNYIANENGDWATSSGYVRFSLQRSIHFGRTYTSGNTGRGREQDLCEALRCLGQALHCLEDFGAHTNYVELALRELGYNEVFSHTGTATEIQLGGKTVFPLVTGTFGGVDFLHSVLGEATDHVTQSEIDEVEKALGDASTRMRGFGTDSIGGARGITDLLSKVPGTGHLCQEAFSLQAASDAQAAQNVRAAADGVQTGGYIPYPGPQGVYPGPQAPAKPAEYGGTGSSSAGTGYYPPTYPGPQEAAELPAYGNEGVHPGPQAQTETANTVASEAQGENANILASQSAASQEPSTYHSGTVPEPSAPTELPTETASGGASETAPSNFNSGFYPGNPAQAESSVPSVSTGSAPVGTTGPAPSGQEMGMTLDPEATIRKIYPILAFRDNVVRSLAKIVEKIPGLEHLVETIQERITLFIMSLLAPYIEPVIAIASKQLKVGSSTVVSASGRHQYEPWTDPTCTDPTHSLLSKDHFSNILNEPAGRVASACLQYVVPRVVYAWENPGVPVDEVVADILHIFHHPVLRDQRLEIHRTMFDTVQQWASAWRGGDLNQLLGSDSVKAGKNHIELAAGDPSAITSGAIFGLGSHSKVAGSPFEALGLRRDVNETGGGGGFATHYQQGFEAPMEGQSAAQPYEQPDGQSYEQDQQPAQYPSYEQSYYEQQQQQPGSGWR